jgi:hypothetical protein
MRPKTAAGDKKRMNWGLFKQSVRAILEKNCVWVAGNGSHVDLFSASLPLDLFYPDNYSFWQLIAPDLFSVQPRQ